MYVGGTDVCYIDTTRVQMHVIFDTTDDFVNFYYNACFPDMAILYIFL